MSNLRALRALSARIGQRALRLCTIIALSILGGLTLVTVILACWLSPWWWLLAIPIVLLLCMFLLVGVTARIILQRLQPTQLTDEQRTSLDAFIDTVQALLEVRAMPPWMFAFIIVKDIVLHRDVVTIKQLITDSTGLRQQYRELERLFA